MLTVYCNDSINTKQVRQIIIP